MSADVAFGHFAAQPLIPSVECAARSTMQLPVPPPTATFVIPVRVTTESNAKENFWTKHRRAKNQRKIVAICVPRSQLPPMPAIVTMTRIGKGEMDDDNVASSLKHVRDEIANLYGVDDGPKSPLRFVVADQEKGDYAVRVTIVSREAAKT